MVCPFSVINSFHFNLLFLSRAIISLAFKFNSLLALLCFSVGVYEVVLGISSSCAIPKIKLRSALLSFSSSCIHRKQQMHIIQQQKKKLIQALTHCSFLYCKLSVLVFVGWWKCLIVLFLVLVIWILISALNCTECHSVYMGHGPTKFLLYCYCFAVLWSVMRSVVNAALRPIHKWWYDRIKLHRDTLVCVSRLSDLVSNRQRSAQGLARRSASCQQGQCFGGVCIACANYPQFHLLNHQTFVPLLCDQEQMGCDTRYTSSSFHTQL